MLKKSLLFCFFIFQATNSVLNIEDTEIGRKLGNIAKNNFKVPTFCKYRDSSKYLERERKADLENSLTTINFKSGRTSIQPRVLFEINYFIKNGKEEELQTLLENATLSLEKEITEKLNIRPCFVWPHYFYCYEKTHFHTYLLKGVWKARLTTFNTIVTIEQRKRKQWELICIRFGIQNEPKHIVVQYGNMLPYKKLPEWPPEIYFFIGDAPKIIDFSPWR